MKKWIDYFTEKNGVAQVFQGQENIPEFKGIPLVNIRVKPSEIVFGWYFPLPIIDLPKKWKDREYNCIHVSIVLDNVQSFKIERSPEVVRNSQYHEYELFDVSFNKNDNLFHFEAFGDFNTKIVGVSRYLGSGAIPFKNEIYDETRI